jgi:hypothetical protein
VADFSDTRLTRRLDLSRVSRATLHFRAWYDLDAGRDFVYLSVSTDDGRTWQRVPSSAVGLDGQGYTGRSGSWVQEEVDLSDFTGHEVLLRFNYVTGYRLGGRGFLFDGPTIPELGLVDPCAELERWQAEGFVLAGPDIPVRWLVQVIQIPTWRDGPVSVRRMALDQRQTGQMALNLDNDGLRTLLAVSALNRELEKPIPYRYAIVER